MEGSRAPDRRSRSRRRCPLATPCAAAMHAGPRSAQSWRRRARRRRHRSAAAPSPSTAARHRRRTRSTTRIGISSRATVTAIAPRSSRGRGSAAASHRSLPVERGAAAERDDQPVRSVIGVLDHHGEVVVLRAGAHATRYVNVTAAGHEVRGPGFRRRLRAGLVVVVDGVVPRALASGAVTASCWLKTQPRSTIAKSTNRSSGTTSANSTAAAPVFGPMSGHRSTPIHDEYASTAPVRGRGRSVTMPRLADQRQTRAC